jgi:uncharacterized caspase-like protein
LRSADGRSAISGGYDGFLRAAVKKDKAERLHVIVFGLNDYQNTGLPSLRYALPDALAIGKALKEAGKGRYASVTVTGVLDPGIVPPKDMDRVFEATSSGLEKAFEAVTKDAEVQDTFVFFAAGHGTAVQGRFHLLGHDYYSEGDTDSSIRSRGIGQEKLQAWIANIKAKRGLILLDSCESGAAVTGASRNDADAALGKLHEATGRLVMTPLEVFSGSASPNFRIRSNGARWGQSTAYSMGVTFL